MINKNKRFRMAFKTNWCSPKYYERKSKKITN